MPNPIGRPPDFSPEIVEEVCARISQGETLIEVARNLGFSYRGVANWILYNKDFNEAYTLAREMQADYRADEIVRLADNGDLTPEDRKVRIQARQWVAAKLRPKTYGDRTILAGDKDNPLITIGTRLDEAIARRNMIDVTPAHTAIEDNSDQI